MSASWKVRSFRLSRHRSLMTFLTTFAGRQVDQRRLGTSIQAPTFAAQVLCRVLSRHPGGLASRPVRVPALLPLRLPGEPHRPALPHRIRLELDLRNFYRLGFTVYSPRLLTSLLRCLLFSFTECYLLVNVIFLTVKNGLLYSFLFTYYFFLFITDPYNFKHKFG